MGDITTTKTLVAASVLGSVLGCAPTAPPAPSHSDLGEAVFVPAEMKSAAIGSYQVRYQVGATGFAAGGGLIVDLPKAWFAHPFPVVKGVQLDDPSAPHYLGAEVERADGSEPAELLAGIDRRSFDGETERFRFRLILLLREDDELHPGDRVVITFANTTAPTKAEADEVTLAVDLDGDGIFQKLDGGARYEVLPEAGRWVTLTAPSQAVVGEPVEVQVGVLDRFYNVASGLTGSLELTGLGPGPGHLKLSAKENGLWTFTWTPRQTGTFRPVVRGRLEAAAGEGAGGEGSPPAALEVEERGGPIRVLAEEPELKIYWGDLHSHTASSKDGLGHGDFAYARDVSRLDFYANTEHATDDPWILGLEPAVGITDEEWLQIRDRVREHYEPGRFVTLLAYECSLPSGHHNVFFRGLDGAPSPTFVARDLENLWSLLERGQAITIPHHLGILWGGSGRRPEGPGLFPLDADSVDVGGGPTLDWTQKNDPEMRPALEIYSAHGQSERYDPDDPLAYENVVFTLARSADGPHYAVDAWAAAQRLGVVAASDNHTATPGLPHWGLTAVYAPELTRGAVFDAIASRRTYGTTGARIVLDFELGGVPMGGEGEHTGTVAGKVLVVAPSPLSKVELMSHSRGGSGSDGDWRVARRWERPGLEVDEKIEVEVPSGGGVFYLRAEMAAGRLDRAARAWSSPIWLGPP